MNNWFSRIPNKYWGYVSLAFWGILSLLLLTKTPYGIDEGAARALLLVWSVVDDVVSPIVTTGLPDFRTVFLVPAGFLWSGNVLAAKITTMVVTAFTVGFIYTWRQRSDDSESALLASGLLLISPLLLDQIDAISAAPYVLAVFALGAWLDKIYREAPLAFGGVYFFQMFLCLVSTTLHPAGLAYPLALLWTWYKTPAGKQQKFFFAGVVFSVLFALLLTLGWHNVDWFTNPIRSLSSVFSGSTANKDIGTLRWITGIGVCLALLLVIWKQASNLWADFLGRIFFVALVLGILVGDETWSTIALAVCLYWGFPLLLRTRISSSESFWGQRGITFLLLFVISTSFMFSDKAHYQKAIGGQLAPRDNLIKSLAENTKNIMDDEAKNAVAKKPLLIASQWPGLTMLACRCGTFPLPPPAKDENELLTMLHGVNYLIFDPSDPNNRSLAHNLSVMDAGKTETVALEEGGVIVEIKEIASGNVAK